MAKKHPPAKRRKKYSRKRRRRKNNKKATILIAIVGGLFLLIIAFAKYTFIRSKQQLFHSFNDPVFSGKYFVRGVDVSHHNSFINWKQLREDNITFVYMKSTEGNTHTDRDYQRNYSLAREAGLKVGTYHFYTFGQNGKLQARHFIENAHVQPGDLRPAIDVEHSPINKPYSDKKERKAIIDELRSLENELFSHYGQRPVIYTNKDCYRLYIDGNFPENPIWMCDLHGEPNLAPDKWVFWQFSHTGKIPGVVNDIDLNYYRYSFTDFRHLLMP